MKIRMACLVVMMVAGSLGTQAQVGILFGGEVRAGASWFSPRPTLSGITMDDAAAFSLDYTHLIGQHFAWNVSYLTTSMDLSGSPGYWYRPKASVNVQSFGLNLQFHMKFGKHVEPYVGAGVNMFYSPSSSKGVILGSGTGAVLLSPAGGFSGGTAGSTFEAGLNWTFAGPLIFNVEAKYLDNGIKMNRYVNYGTAAIPVFFPAGTTNLKVNPFIISAGIGFRW